MRTACVVQASPVMHAFGACMERIASPITAQRHHLSLICKQKGVSFHLYKSYF
jgi:hypothetical protein